jgi:hypothetical protein
MGYGNGMDSGGNIIRAYEWPYEREIEKILY